VDRKLGAMVGEDIEPDEDLRAKPETHKLKANEYMKTSGVGYCVAICAQSKPSSSGAMKTSMVHAFSEEIVDEESNRYLGKILSNLTAAVGQGATLYAAGGIAEDDYDKKQYKAIKSQISSMSSGLGLEVSSLKIPFGTDPDSSLSFYVGYNGAIIEKDD